MVGFEAGFGVDFGDLGLAVAGDFLAPVAGLAVDFLVVGSLTPAVLAILAREALRREAVFFLSRPFLTALSSSDWALLRVEAVGLALNSLVADLMDFLICWFCVVRLTV